MIVKTPKETKKAGFHMKARTKPLLAGFPKMGENLCMLENSRTSCILVVVDMVELSHLELLIL